MADFPRGLMHLDWVKRLDYRSLKKVNSSHVSYDLPDRADIIIWRVKRLNERLYLYLLIEFQSRIDDYMAFRIIPIPAYCIKI